MQGLDAISAANGWSMAVLGATIVFSGLVLLSLTISQLKRIISLIERKEKPKDKVKGSKQDDTVNKPQENSCSDYFLEDIHKTAELYCPLVEKLGDTFKLEALYKLCQDENFPHPHLSIQRFRYEQILKPSGDDSFTWNL